ncbi:ABC transporter substrate-binding protein [Roseibium sp.]|uniref:ABC transporter substrate-binding protein n=1 Tax=Roseibium sp. TaxID=1936156 RepID=UPI003B522B9D
MRHRSTCWATLFSLLSLGLAVQVTQGFANEPELIERFEAPSATQTLIVRSTADISIYAPVVEAFLETQSDLAIVYEQWGSNDLYSQTRQECREDAPAADVVISSGVHQMVKLVNEACAQSHVSRETEQLPPALRWRDELWGITREPAVVVYNQELVPPDEVPKSRFDLLDLLRPTYTRYAGRIATYDIERSGLGYLFAFIDAQEASTFGALQEAFVRTQAVLSCCSSDIIRGVAEGRYLIAYNVLGSYAQGYQQTDDRIGIVLPSDYTLVLSRALMIPKGVDNTAAAAEFLDFQLSRVGQRALREALLISPLLETEEGAEGETLSSTALRPIGLSPSLMVARDQLTRETFLKRWRVTFPVP